MKALQICNLEKDAAIDVLIGPLYNAAMLGLIYRVKKVSSNYIR